MSRPARRRLREDTPVTFDFAPMVDVVMLLLIFFFLTSSLQDGAAKQALPLDLPRASMTVQETPDLPVVSVDAAGKIYLAGEPITLEGLAQQLPPLVQASGGLVGLRADQSGNYGTVVKVMDTIKAAGGERLALSTEAAGTGNAAGGGP
ncbi:Biopolymer transport protein ExbD/TolR [Deinococcus proteolyticus MRP]|uniref:Biopolymer transport protein ExbD/TolR n=1 Tax=Deinococcus proteolyticus (strain ATCC 35074 / DSM 20540 / JCM 6276 / NBRC 101906 / NCIMB 13154 / VKM Ac-1939 / CCM 2703 / MRP) TaxID=693977 RepID=F0RKW9_DEIPM|nr:MULTISPECIES: biopolymer transporter ExbD [Deinococcus]ADY25742.1 Biopolymer transport protein ExbD/TolR [Deinococcus proteolyticus MRP]MCY1701866.1 biopolymer transporter ExbD [Deinococcus sp. SL84]